MGPKKKSAATRLLALAAKVEAQVPPARSPRSRSAIAELLADSAETPKIKDGPADFVEDGGSFIGDGWKIVDVMAQTGANVVITSEEVCSNLNNWDPDVISFEARHKVKRDDHIIVGAASFLASDTIVSLPRCNAALSQALTRTVERRRVLLDQYASTDALVPFYILPELLTSQLKGIAVIGHPTRTAVRLTHCRLSHSWTGPMVSVSFGLFVYGPLGPTPATGQHLISGYEGGRTLRQLGIELRPSAETLAVLSARGRRAHDLAASVAYARTSGTMQRRVWYRWYEVPAAGRLLVDPVGHDAVDPNKGLTDYELSRDHLDVNGALKDEDYAIFDPYVTVFSFVTKTWGRIDVDKVEPIQFRPDAFEQLVMPADDKRLVLSLVRNTDPTVVSDIIDGKGGGCVLLFHGAPGRGKTLTAEAVAEHLKRPLYAVSVGDLGTDAEGLEERLGQCLRLAERWKAVLLLDEADVFLEQRQAGDIVRNAMVGTFLRLCEYYAGVLILTTNRVKEIDEAFYSRVSLALHYEDFDAPRRMQVVRNLLAVNGVELSNDAAASIANVAANGRQIKNAIRIARFVARDHGREVSASDIVDLLRRLTSFSKTPTAKNGAAHPELDA